MTTGGYTPDGETIALVRMLRDEVLESLAVGSPTVLEANSLVEKLKGAIAYCQPAQRLVERYTATCTLEAIWNQYYGDIVDPGALPQLSENALEQLFEDAFAAASTRCENC